MQVGRYETERELGRGGMGIVYAARDPEGRPVALKLLKPGGSASRERRFVREVEALTRLRHENVVRILDAGDHHGWLYLVTELVTGEALDEVLARDGALEPERAARIARDVARGVAHAHAHGVLHRDLKPSNVIVDAEGRARVIDFGLARDVAGPGSLTHSGQLLGTPGFWSPEQARGDRAAVGTHSDVYGIGAVLYAALTHDPPAQGNTLQELLIATCHRPTPPASSVRPEVDRELDAICLRALAKAPAERWPSAEALADALDAWLAARGASTPAASRPRARLPLAAAALLVPVVLALAAGAVYRTGDAPGLSPPDPPKGVAASWEPDGPASQEDPDAPAAPDVAALTSRGLELLRARDLEAAAAAFDEALAADPTHAPALAGRARALAERGDVRGALAAAERAVAQDPGCADAWYARGDVYARHDPPDDERALADFERALALDPDHPEALAARGWLRFDLRTIDDILGALADLTRALERRPDPWTYVMRALVHVHLGRPDAAMADFAASIALEPTARAHYERARLLDEEERPLEALADLDRAIDLDPQPAYLRARSRVREQLGDLAGARADLERAVDLTDDDPFWLVRLGDARLDDGDLAGAEEAYTRAIKVAPDEPTAWIARGHVRTQRKDYVNARVDLDQALARAPGDPRVYFGRGVLRYEVKDLDGAFADWGRAAELDPDDPWPHYRRGALLRERGQPEQAVAELDQALRRWPSMPDALAERALAKRDLGDLDAAISDLTMAREMSPPGSPERARFQQLLDETQARRQKP